MFFGLSFVFPVASLSSLPFSCGVCMRPLAGLFEFFPHPGMRGVLLGRCACEFGPGAGEAGLGGAASAWAFLLAAGGRAASSDLVACAVRAARARGGGLLRSSLLRLGLFHAGAPCFGSSLETRVAGLRSGVSGPPLLGVLSCLGMGGVTALRNSPQVSSASGCVGAALSKVVCFSVSGSCFGGG